MPGDSRVLITGGNGLIGRALRNALCGAGYDVWGADINGDPSNQILAVDLLSRDEAKRIIALARPFSVVIHTAALAHGQNPPAGKTVFDTNTDITRNVLAAVENDSPWFIFLSSVSVYGEDGRVETVHVSDEPTPATEYARSKLACEELIRESSLADYDILRLAPVFEDSYPINARKRVFVPGLPSVKMRLYPPPRHSLCSLATVGDVVSNLLREGPSGQRVRNVCDTPPYDQHEMASWFSGVSIPVPVCLLGPLYWLLCLFPKERGHALRSLYWKLFRSNVYSPTEERTRRRES